MATGSWVPLGTSGQSSIPQCGLCGSSPANAGSGMCASCESMATGQANVGTFSAPLAGAVVLPGGWVLTSSGSTIPSGGVIVGVDPLPRDDLRLVDLIGWRIWRVTGSGYLRSLTAEVIWLPGEPMEAAEITDQGAASNGIHVFAERAGAVKEMTTYLHSEALRKTYCASYALGSVLLWGEVVEHERGYRAERAKILSIDDVVWEGKPPWDGETKKALAFLRERYGVAG